MSTSRPVSDPTRHSPIPVWIGVVGILIMVLSISAGAAFILSHRPHDSVWNLTGEKEAKYISSELVVNDKGSALSFTAKDTQPTKTVDIYSDPQCGHCSKLHELSGATLKEHLLAGNIALNIHYLSFLDSHSATPYSAEISGAQIAATKAGQPNVSWVLYESMWKNKPTTHGHPAPHGESMGKLLRQAGASDELADRSSENDKAMFDDAKDMHRSNVEALTDKVGQVFTPVVLVDGEFIDDPMGDLSWMDQL